MKLPNTAAIAAVLTAAAGGVIAFASPTYHWTGPQTFATTGAAAATVALISFLVEHLRPGSPSRWVAVLGLIPAEISGVITLGIVFFWWGESAVEISGFVLAVVTPIAAVLGVTIAQAQVYSPETATRNVVDVAAAKAVDPETHAR